MKNCLKCGLDKSIDSFGIDRINGKDGISTQCVDCRRGYKREWLRQNRDRVYEGQIKKRYGITLAEYDSLSLRQNGACAICGGISKRRRIELFRSLSVDHDHETGRVRGLLCDRCNLGLGQFRHSTELLTLAMMYLEEQD